MSGDLQSDIRSLTLENLQDFFLQHGIKKFRAGQTYDWLWKNGCQSFGEMTNLSKMDRLLLSQHFSFNVARANHFQTAGDGTVKVVFKTDDNHLVEGVLIPSANRYTACISSQVGCALGCKFCATGRLGFSRNLTAGEIFDQVVVLARYAGMKKAGKETANPEKEQKGLITSVSGHDLSNIVFMGMGEPLLNYLNVTNAISKITAPLGMNFSSQRITVSSVGIPKMIKKMADDGVKFHFALSLHAATDEKRDQIIPVNRKFPLSEVSESLKYLYHKTGKRITIEYILFHNLNDTRADAQALACFCRNFPVKINLITYNQVRDSGFVKSTGENMKSFTELLEQKNLVVNVRKSRGEDIEAACGQLAGSMQTTSPAK